MGEMHIDEFEPDLLVKSLDRVRDLGEVYTPANIVDDMLDLLPKTIWTVHPSPTFFEPSVGNGNFVAAILQRKLSFVDRAFKSGKLPAGETLEAAEFHALEALSSIYGVDISEDNIIGGTPGHEIACRPRLMSIMERWHKDKDNPDALGQLGFLKSAKWIIEHNMIIGNMLARGVDGKPTGRDEIVIMAYKWHPSEKRVTVSKTTMGSVIREAEESQSDVLALFGAEPAVEVWEGSARDIFSAQNHATLHLTGEKISNSRGGSK